MDEIERVAEAVRQALVDLSEATVTETEVAGDAQSFNVQIGDQNVNVAVGGSVSA
jgi:hypothetical protein